MTSRLSHLLPCFVLCLSMPAAEPAENPLSLSLVTGVTSVKPGTEFYVALQLKHPEGYHTYWKHPGVVGIPTQIEWILPEGVTAGEIQWPAPIRVKMADINAHGYHGEIHLPVKISVSPDYKGASISLKGKVIWMCCARTCHPGFRELDLELPVVTDSPANQVNKDVALAVEKSLAAVPASTSQWKATAKRVPDGVELTVLPIGPGARTDLGDIYFFSADGMVDSDQPQVKENLSSGGFVLKMKTWRFSPDDTLTFPGILWSQNGWETAKENSQHVEINPDLPPQNP